MTLALLVLPLLAAADGGVVVAKPGVRGTVLALDGSGVAGAEVRLASKKRPTDFRVTRSGDGGVFVFEQGVTPPMGVGAFHPGYGHGLLWLLDGGTHVELMLDGLLEVPVLVTLQGKPLEGAQVRLSSTGDAGGPRVPMLATRPNGRATIAEVPPGPYELVVSLQGREVVRQALEVKPRVSNEQKVELASNGTGVLVRAVDARGLPVAGVQVKTKVLGQWVFATSGADGRLLILGVPRGEKVSLEPASDAHRFALVAESGRPEVELKVSSAPRLTALVRSAQGPPPTQAVVFGKTVPLGAGGALSVAEPRCATSPPRTLTLSAPGHVAREVPVPANCELGEVVLQLARPLEVQVETSSGQRVPAAKVCLRGTAQPCGVTDGEGRTILESPGDRLDLRVDAQLAGQVASAPVQGGRAVIRLPRAVTVTVKGGEGPRTLVSLDDDVRGSTLVPPGVQELLLSPGRWEILQTVGGAQRITEVRVDGNAQTVDLDVLPSHAPR